MKELEVKESGESSPDVHPKIFTIREEERSASRASQLNDSETEDNASVLSTTTTNTSRSKSPTARLSKIRRHSKSSKVVKAMFKYK